MSMFLNGKIDPQLTQGTHARHEKLNITYYRE